MAIETANGPGTPARNRRDGGGDHRIVKALQDVISSETLRRLRRPDRAGRPPSPQSDG